MNFTDFFTNFLDRFRAAPSQHKFADLLMSAMRASGDTRTWIYENSKSRLVHLQPASDTPSNIINLHNMFREYAQAKPTQRKAILNRQANGMIQQYVPADFAEAKTKLRPVVRSATERGVLDLQTRTQPIDKKIAYRPLCENIEIGIAYDGEFSLIRLANSKLQEWGITFDEALDIAVDNLRLESSKPWAALQNGVFLSQFGDFYDASRVLLPDLLHRQPISGSPVVMLPNRTTLLLTGDRNPAGLETMLQVAEQALTQPRSLPPLMLRWDGLAWQRFIPEALDTRLKQLRVQEQAGDYHDQQTMLNEAHARDSLDVFVAQYTVVKRTSGEMFSVCVWSDNVHSLLPKTDFVVLYRNSPKQLAYVPWEVLSIECGELMSSTENLPVRYEVKAFPEESLFQALCARFPSV